MNAMQPPQSIEEIKAGLETTEKGGVRQSIRNCLTVFQRDPLLSGAIAYNILTDRKDIIKPIGFHRDSTALNDTALGKLMHDFSCTSAEEMHYQILADRVRYYKEDREGVATMCKAMEDMRNEAVKENAIKAARSFLALGKLSYEEIANSLGLTVDEVKALDESKPA